MASPLFRINGGAVGAMATVSAGGAVTATLDSTDGVRGTEWFIDTTDDLSEPGDYVLLQSGSVGQTVSTTALGVGTGAKLRARINGGNDIHGRPDAAGTNATGKFVVLTDLGRVVGVAGEEFETDPTNGSAGIINAAVREDGSTSITDIIAVAPIAESGTTTRTISFTTFPNTADATIGVDSVAAGDGKNLLLNAGDVSAGGGTGGSIALTSGTGTGPTGNVVCVMPIAGGISGMFKLNDGTNNFLDAKATAALSTFTFDRQLLLTGGTTVTFEASAALTISADTGAGGNALILKVSNAEISRLKTTGLEIEKGVTFSITQPQSTSGAGRDLSITAQRGAAGTNGGDVVLSVGAAGTAGSDLQGECLVALGNSGDLTGIARWTGGAFGDLLTLSYDDTVGESAISSPTYQLSIVSALGIGINASGGSLALSCGGSNSVTISAGSIGIEVQQSSGLKIGFFGATPIAKPTITGSRGGNAALASLLTEGANLGLWIDGTSA